MRDAVLESGLPKQKDVETLYFQIFTEPETPPTADILAPLISFIRESLKRNVPLNWFVGKDLQQTLAPLDGIRKTLLHGSTHEVVLTLLEQGKITVAGHPNLSAKALEESTREASMEMLVLLSQQLGMDRSMRDDEIKHIELYFHRRDDTHLGAHANIRIQQENQEEVEYTF